jgi:4-amino-4-deoxy-L-arabinose transferase-like glycosyltransferase
MKLDEMGMEGYTLRNINMYGNRKYPELVTFGIAQDKGALLKGLKAGGITYYDEPLHHMPFGFPYALVISHKMFAQGQPYHALAIPNDTAVIREAPPGAGLRDYRFDPEIAGKQFYAIIVPLFFSMVLIISTFFLARALYGDNATALTAMFLMAISPIDILTSQKVWADDMTAGLTALAALLYVLSRKKKIPVLALAGGMLSGVAIITKQMAAILPVAIVVWHFLSNFDRLFKKETFLKVIFDKELILFGAGAIATSAYWFYKITSVYGDPLYRPHQPDLLEKSKTAWFAMMQNRPRHLYLLGIPYQNPLFGLAYISPLWLLFDKKNFRWHLFAVTWLAVTFFMSYRFFTGEHRYMLPFYASFAVLGAYVVNKIKIWCDLHLGAYTGTAILLIALLVSAFWSVPMGMEAVLHNKAVIMKPF